MTKRIHWVKGMRLTERLLRQSDECTMEVVNKCFVLAASGGFGLLPSTGTDRFEATLDVQKNYVELYSLRCLGLTRSGWLIDVDSDATSTERIPIPADSDANELLLMAQMVPGPWKESGEELEEPRIAFELVSADLPLTFDRSLPVARIAREGEGWRLDEDFLPPLLFITSHPRMEELAEQFSSLLLAADQESLRQVHSEGMTAISVFWPVVQQLRIAMDKDKERMTPMQLLGNVQKFVSAFVCGAKLDENLHLVNADIYRNYAYTPYSYSNVYRTVRAGLQMCFDIVNKVRSFQEKPQPEPETVSSPYISDAHLLVVCKNNNTVVPIDNVDDGATVFFTTNRRHPNPSSDRAKKASDGSFFIEFPNDFQPKGMEADKQVTITMIATKNGLHSGESVFEVTLRKDLGFKYLKKSHEYEI